MGRVDRTSLPWWRTIGSVDDLWGVHATNVPPFFLSTRERRNREKKDGGNRSAATVITALMIAYKELRYDPIHVAPGADKVIFFWFPPWRIKFGSRVNRVG